jgi:anti-anti-sigma factor
VPCSLVPASLVDDHGDVAPPMSACSSRGDRDAAWVEFVGAWDSDATPRMERLLRGPNARARLTVVDLRRVTSIDRSGVQTLVEAGARARLGGGRLVLVRAPPDVDRVFGLIGPGHDLAIVDLDPMEPPVQALLALAQQERPAWR